MPTKDQPPESIWLDDDALGQHFDRVKASYGSSSDAEDEPATPLSQNALTKGLTRG